MRDLCKIWSWIAALMIFLITRKNRTRRFWAWMEDVTSKDNAIAQPVL
jgi:hypothetical protein